MDIFDRFRSKKNEQKIHGSAEQLDKDAATGDTKKTRDAVGKADKTSAKIEQQTQTQSNKQSGKLDKQFDSSDAASQALFGGLNDDINADEVDQLLKKTQENSFPDVPTHAVGAQKIPQAQGRQQPPVQQAPAQARPKQQTEHQKNMQLQEIRRAKLHAAHAEKMGKLKQAQQYFEGIAANTSSGQKKTNPNVGKVTQVHQEKQKTPTAARSPKSVTVDFPNVPTSPISIKKDPFVVDEEEKRLNKILMDQFEQDEPEQKTAKQDLEEMLMNEFDPDESETLSFDEWEQQLQDELDAENTSPKSPKQ